MCYHQRGGCCPQHNENTETHVFLCLFIMLFETVLTAVLRYRQALRTQQITRRLRFIVEAAKVPAGGCKYICFCRVSFFFKK